MKVIFTIGGLSPTYGGPSQSIPALARTLADMGVQVEIITTGEKQKLGKQKAEMGIRGEMEDGRWEMGVRVTRVAHRNRTVGWVGSRNDFATALRASCDGAADCVIHDTGLWLPTNHATAWAARQLGRPLVVSPRGMLTAWALRFRGLKKRVAWWLYQRQDLASARVLHATSRAEAEGFRAVGMKQPVAVIPNGVEVPALGKAESRKQKAEIEVGIHPPLSTFHSSNRTRTVLFLGRIHPVKGLVNLVRAWAKGKAESKKQKAEIGMGWRVVVAGQDDGGHLEEVKAESKKQKVEMDFEFVGVMEGEAKWELYRQADLFVLPSFSENFGIVVAEALACGVPVVTTRGTPWEELVTHRCGWWVEMGAGAGVGGIGRVGGSGDGVERLAGALVEAMALSDAERREMGERGRALIESKYAWGRVAEQMFAAYEWVLGKGERPGWVQT